MTLHPMLSVPSRSRRESQPRIETCNTYMHMCNGRPSRVEQSSEVACNEASDNQNDRVLLHRHRSSCRGGPPAGAARLPLQPSPRPRHWKLGPFRAEPQLQTRQLSLPIGSPIFSTEHCPPAPVFFFLFLSSHSPSSQIFFTSHDDTQVSWKNTPKRNKNARFIESLCTDSPIVRPVCSFVLKLHIPPSFHPSPVFSLTQLEKPIYAFISPLIALCSFFIPLAICASLVSRANYCCLRFYSLDIVH